VDDSPLDLERATGILAQNYEVQAFRDGSEALERLNDSTRPDAMVVDWEMPGVTGLDVCRFLRTSGEEIPTLLLTSHGETAQLVEGLAAGASDYLTKPYAEAELTARVASLLRTRELLDRARTAEETITHLLSVSPDPLFAVDRAGRVTYANAQAQRALGLREAQIIGRMLATLVPGLDVQRIRAASGRSETPTDVQIGDHVYAPSIGVSSGPYPTFAIALRNVTNRRREEARRLDLYSVVAHDLRTPLTSMLMRTELILSGDRGLLAAELSADLRKMQRNIREMVAMINDFLELARYEGGGYKLEYEEMDLCEVLRQTVDDFQPLALASRHHLTLVPATCHATVMGDRRRLSQAVANLVGNAIKFTPAGGSVTLNVDVDVEFVTTSVVDTGEGISPESARTLFQRYQRAGESQQTVPGTGLGLMIVREIVELHGGTVGVDSALGRGSKFWFRLPRPSSLRASA
jgi:two-component system phosphate regulon sensor histidine kinase PhoR